MFYKKTCRTVRPQLRLAFEKIQIVRRDRGTRAAGDALLKSAQKALQFHDPRSALLDLESYKRLVRDVSPPHCAILKSARFRLSHRWFLALPPPQVRDLIILTIEIFRWLTNKHPLSCQQVRLFRLNRCIRLSNISVLKNLPASWALTKTTSCT